MDVVNFAVEHFRAIDAPESPLGIEYVSTGQMRPGRGPRRAGRGSHRVCRPATTCRSSTWCRTTRARICTAFWARTRPYGCVLPTRGSTQQFCVDRREPVEAGGVLLEHVVDQRPVAALAGACSRPMLPPAGALPPVPSAARRTRKSRRSGARRPPPPPGDRPRRRGNRADRSLRPAARSPRSPRCTIVPLPCSRRISGGPVKAQNMITMRPFWRTCAIVSAPLPTTSRYATVWPSSTRKVPIGPLGDRLMCPPSPEGAEPTKNIGWCMIHSASR